MADQEHFRVATNTLWYRVEYKGDRGPWVNVNTLECYSCIPSKFTDLQEAIKVLNFLQRGGDPYHFEDFRHVDMAS